MPRSLARILVVRNDRLGDLLLTLPTFAALRDAYPTARLTALTTEYTATLAASSPLVDDVIVDRPHTRASALAEMLRSRGFDAALAIHTTSRNSWAIWRAGIPIRVGWAHKPFGMLFSNRRVFLRRSHPPIHEARFGLAFAEKLAGSRSRLQPESRLEPNDDVMAGMQERIDQLVGSDGPLFCIHPGNGGSAFNWPPCRYAAAANSLARHGRVLLTGGADERELLEELCSEVRCDFEQRVGVLTDASLPELAAILSLADTLTVSSTGPMHLAAAVGTPVVALFSPHEVHQPLKWAPLGGRHVVLSPALAPGEGARCGPDEGSARMKRIGVEHVLRANLNLTTTPRASQVDKVRRAWAVAAGRPGEQTPPRWTQWDSGLSLERLGASV